MAAATIPPLSITPASSDIIAQLQLSRDQPGYRLRSDAQQPRGGASLPESDSTAPTEANPKYFYVRWLKDRARFPEAAGMLRPAIMGNASYTDAYYQLMQLYADQFDASDVREIASRMLALFPTDRVVADWLARSSNA